jgi:hypothetical protein
MDTVAMINATQGNMGYIGTLKGRSINELFQAFWVLASEFLRGSVSKQNNSVERGN